MMFKVSFRWRIMVKDEQGMLLDEMVKEQNANRTVKQSGSEAIWDKAIGCIGYGWPPYMTQPCAILAKASHLENWNTCQD